MNIEHLKLFVRIAVTHNISRAGSELGLSPAVASAQVNKLEDTLSIRLVHRTTRKVSLTEEGKAFLPHAQSVLESVEAARASVGNGSVQPEGTLRVSASASFGRMHIIPALNLFLEDHPGINVQLSLSDRIVDLVEGGFDLAIRDAALHDSSMFAKRMANVKRIVCASPEYLKKHGCPETPEELRQHQCTNLMGLQSWQFQTPDGIKTIKTNNKLLTDNGEATRDACIAGMGITISSTWCCYKQLQNGELLQILSDFPLISNTDIWAVYPSSRLLAPKVRLFMDFLTTYFHQKPAEFVDDKPQQAHEFHKQIPYWDYDLNIS